MSVRGELKKIEAKLVAKQAETVKENRKIMLDSINKLEVVMKETIIEEVRKQLEVLIDDEERIRHRDKELVGSLGKKAGQ